MWMRKIWTAALLTALGSLVGAPSSITCGASGAVFGVIRTY